MSDTTADKMQDGSAGRGPGTVEPVSEAHVNAEVNATYGEQAGADRTTDSTASEGGMTTPTMIVYTPAKNA